MKHFGKNLLAALLLLPAMLPAQQLMPFTVKGTIGHFSAPYKIYLAYTGPNQWTTDSVTLKDGAFNFTGEVRTPRKAYLAINANGNSFNPRRDEYKEICLEQGTVTVESPDSLDNIKVTGGKVNADFTVLTKIQEPTAAKLGALSKEWRATPVEERKSKTFQDNFEKKNSAIYAERQQVDMEFIKNNPMSWVSLLIIYDYNIQGQDLHDFVPLFKTLSPGLKASTIGVALATKMENADKTAIGIQAPDFTLPDVSGKKISLHDFKGKYVLIDFWASWCGPCRAENPNVIKAYAAYKAKGFTILGVSLDDSSSKSKWIAAIHKDQLNWTQVSDGKGWQSQPVLMFAVTGIPQNFLISPEGKIIAKNLRGDDLDKKLKELL